MFFDPAEGLDRQALEELQSIRLRDAVRLAARSSFYNRVFRENSLDPDSLRGLEDLARIPLTGKEHLRETYPDGMLCLPISEMVRLHASSGTTGTATVIFHTAKDLRTWADLVARCFFMVGVRSEDVFQNMSGYGLFTGGLGIHYGAERLGCLTIPAGAGNSKRQIKLFQDFKVTVIHIIPSYALHLAAVFEGLGIDPRSLNLRIALVGAEPHTEETRRRIEDIYGLKAFNSSGLSEMNGPGVAFECPEQNGMHLWEDAFIAEIAVAIDPVTLKPVPEGQTGELVMTTLTREGMPILRYRTRDLTRFLPGSCPCGRTQRRIDRILGRSDDMIINGVNIFPMQVEHVFMGIPEVGHNYLISP